MVEIRMNGQRQSPNRNFAKAQAAYNKFNQSPEGQAFSSGASEQRFTGGLASLYQRMQALESRAAQPQRPSTFVTMQRAIDSLEHAAAAFEYRFGHRPFAGGQTSRLRTSLGTSEGAQMSAAILRMGSLGQSKGINHDYSELVKIERQLKQIDKAVEAQLKFATNPSAQANLSRQRDALYVAKERITSGLVGSGHRTGLPPEFAGIGGGGSSGPSASHSRFSYSNIRATYARMRGGFSLGHGHARGGGAGGFISGLSEAAELGGIAGIGAVAGVATAGAAAALAAPLVLSGAQQALVGAQRPWLDYRIRETQLARAGGFSSRSLEGLTMPARWSEFAGGLAGAGMQSRMTRLGLSPEDVLRLNEATGISPTSGRGAYNTAAAVRSGFLAPNMGLSESQIGGMLGSARTLGTVTPGRENAYMARLQRAMTVATGQGLDHSRVGSTMSALLQNAAGAGALGSPSFGRAADFWNRLQSSGAPGMRSGEGIVATANAIDQAAGSIGVAGGDIRRDQVVQSFFQRRGGMPKTEDALRKSLGVTRKDWDKNWVNTPASQQALANYEAAAKAGSPLALDYLGPMLIGHRETMLRIFNGSQYGDKSVPSYLRPVFEKEFLGTTMGQQMALDSVPNRSLAASGVGNPSQRVNSMIWRLGSDLGLSINQAAGIVSNLYAESGVMPIHQAGVPFNRGGINIAQWTGPRRKAFESWAKAHGLDPLSQEAGVQYLEFSLTNNHPDILKSVRNQSSATGAAQAFFPYENAPTNYAGHINNAATFAQNYAGNVPLDAMNKEASGQIAQLDRARYVSNVVDAGKVMSGAVVSFVGAADAAGKLGAAFDSLRTRVEAIEHKHTTPSRPVLK